MLYYSPLRYPGGKAKLSKFMKLILEQNKILDGVYIEPYAGGSGIALELLMNEYVNKIIINDLDYSIYSFWYSVLNHSTELCEMIKDTPVDVATWKYQKYVQQEKEKHSILDVGFSTFFLNRTNRSGIIKGGVIGGNQQNGKWKMDVRFNKIDLITRISKISRYKDRIELYNQDACVFIDNIRKGQTKKTLFYIDPPYYVKGKELYEHHYNHDDHVNISNIIKSIKNQNWIITYDYVPQICELYEGLRQIQYSLSYSVAIKQKGTEVMIFDNNLKIPKIKNPVSINN